MLETKNSYMHDVSLYDALSLGAKIEALVRDRIWAIKACPRTSLFPHHAPGVNLKFFEILFAEILSIVFDPLHSVHVLYVRATFK